MTSLAHLIQDFEQQTPEEDLTHLEEILQWHDLSRDPGAGTREAFTQRSKRNIENRCLHHHVFDTRLAVEMIHHVGLQIIAVEVFRPYHVFLIARKPAEGQAVRNDCFRGVDAVTAWRSSFPTDKASAPRG